MSKKKLIFFILMNFANYLPILVSILCYRMGALIVYPLLIALQAGLIILNALTAPKPSLHILLSVHLLIATIIANVVDVLLYILYTHGANETLTMVYYDERISLLLMLYVVGIGCLLVIAGSIGAIYFNRPNQKYV